MVIKAEGLQNGIEQITRQDDKESRGIEEITFAY